MPENYETNEDGSLKLDNEGNPILKTPVPPVQDSIPPWMVAVNAANIERDRLTEENRLLRTQVQAPPPPVAPVLEAGALYNDPNSVVDAISRRLEAQIAPLRNFQAQFERNQAYQNLKNRAKMMIPAVANFFSRGTEPLVDQEMANQEPTEANFARAIETVAGRITLQNPSFFSTTNPPTSATPAPPTTPVIPPHLSPSRPANIQLMPSNTNAQKDPANWDENERRLWRESGESAEDYYDLTHADPNNLTELYKSIQEKKRKAGAK